MAQTTKIRWQRPNVVGTLHSARGWAAAARAPVDLIEVRVDCLPVPPSPAQLARLPRPVLLTVRDPREGGARPLPTSERVSLFLELLPAAVAVDVEARNLRAMREVGEAARAAGLSLIASFHDFRGVPGRIAARAARAREEGAQIIKVAATTESARDMARLLRIFEQVPPPVAVMGMGKLGRVSRLVCAACGSCLNYGWLAAPQVSGQWPARALRALFRQLGL